MNEPPRGDGLPALSLRGIDKRYGATQALASASLRVRAGTVHALLGENGAGKTTLMHIAYGMARADAGTIELYGRTARFDSPADAIAGGVGMVHQHFTLVPAMTVAENVALGGHGRLELARIVTDVRDLSERTGLALVPEARVETLPVAAQQRVEIAKALMRRARILVLDEPTAVLPPSDAAELLRWLRTFADEGHAVVLITHKLGEALGIADDVTVLRRGRTVLTAPRAEASTTLLTAAMLGSTDVDESLSPALSIDHARSRQPIMDVILRAEYLSIADAHGRLRVREASVEVRAGEIVGVVAVEGSGQHELLRALAGRLAITAGKLSIPSAVGFVPEDRHRDAVLLDRQLVENIALRGARERRGIMDWNAMRVRTESLMRTFDVRAAGPDARMRALSGGNQQKLVLARELDVGNLSGPRAIVVENPTRGLDVRATADVHARLRAARDAGAAVVMYSSDIDEVLLLANRVIVVFAGRVREAPVDRDVVGRLMLGAETHVER